MHGRLSLVVLGTLAAIAARWQEAPAVEIWSPNICVPIFEGPDYSGKDDPAALVRIAGARNGAFWGQVVVFSSEPCPGPEAVAGELKAADGSDAIPASAVEIRYARPTGSERDARPGRYAGQLSLAGRRVPVELSVSDWRLPDPRDFTTYVGIIQSPDSVALQYKVPLWSERHFELIGRSLDALAPLGNKSIYLPLICQTHFGNSESMVRWVRDGEKLSHDFSLAEKYLDLFLQRIGKPKVVVLYAWDIFCGGGYFADKGIPPVGPPVTLLDAKTGATETMTGPLEGTPEGEAFWRPVLDGLRERLARRGLGDEALMIGIAQDVRPSKEVVAMFERAAPYARWVVHSHSNAQNINGAVVGCMAHVWNARHVPDPDQPPAQSYLQRYYYGWKQDFLITVFPRDGGSNSLLNPPLWADAPLAVQHQVLEGTLSANQRGIERIGADFWPVLEQEGHRGMRPILNRYPAANWHQLSASTAVASVLHPGPDGALPTWRLELIREGLQECEAKIYLEKSLLDKAARARLGEQLAGRCEEALKERVRIYRNANPMYKECAQKGWDWWTNQSGWPQRSAQLFALAAEMAALTAH